MTYTVLEIQEISGVPTVVQQPMTDSSNIKEAKSIALQKAGYWANPPAGITPPPSVTVMAINREGRVLPGYIWNFAFEQPEPVTGATGETGE